MKCALGMGLSWGLVGGVRGRAKTCFSAVRAVYVHYFDDIRWWVIQSDCVMLFDKAHMLHMSTASKRNESSLYMKQLTDLKEDFMHLHFLVNQLAVLPQERAQKQTQILNEILLIVMTILVCFFDISSYRQHLHQNKISIGPHTCGNPQIISVV